MLAKIKNPGDPTKEEVENIKKNLLEKFKDVFSVEEQLGAIKCMPMKIELKPGAIPTCISAPRKIGLSIAPKAKSEVGDMEKKDLIEKVKADHPTEWCHPFNPREKPNGGVRITLDMRGLN